MTALTWRAICRSVKNRSNVLAASRWPHSLTLTLTRIDPRAMPVYDPHHHDRCLSSDLTRPTCRLSHIARRWPCGLLVVPSISTAEVVILFVRMVSLLGRHSENQPERKEKMRAYSAAYHPTLVLSSRYITNGFVLTGWHSVYVIPVLLTRTWASRPRPRTWRQNTFKDRFWLRGAREHTTKKK